MNDDMRNFSQVDNTAMILLSILMTQWLQRLPLSSDNCLLILLLHC